MSRLGEIKPKMILNDLKSAYLRKNLFFFLSEKQKLEIIKYNKELQSNLFVDIYDYMYFSRVDRCELIIDKNGKGEQTYFHSHIVYEGDFLHGKKNGKIKKYSYKFYDKNDKKLIFEGEYKNGLRDGKGKEYYENGKLKFEGEFLNGNVLNGKGYNIKGELDYEIINGNGYIKEYDEKRNYLIYEGEYKNMKRNGKGKEYNYDGKIIFEGEYLDGKRWNGKGYNNQSEIEYEIKNGKGNKYKIKVYDYGELTMVKEKNIMIMEN